MVRYLTAILGTLFIGWGAFSSSAQVQALCDERDAIVASLENIFSEAPVSMGLGSNGAIIEIFASPSGTFTIVLTRPNGLTCVMAAGQNWEDLPDRLTGAKI